jgi:hypothetical protein
MFDFRYHAMSLVAVFVALAVGLVLGVTIGDKGLVSSARQSLRRDVVSNYADEVRSLRSELGVRRDFEAQVYPSLVAGRLAGERFGIVFIGGSSDPVANAVRTALEGTGGALRFVAVVRDPPDLNALAARASAGRYAGLATDPTLVRPFARSIGRSLMAGGRLSSKERQPLLSTLSGVLGRVDGIVVVRLGPAPSGDGANQTRDFEEGLVEGMAATDGATVGVETTRADPSQVPWYRSLHVSSVDDVDDLAGRAALVLVLGGAKGSYGVKPLATDGLLPRLVAGG